jgi:hypothetical protein
VQLGAFSQNARTKIYQFLPIPIPPMAINGIVPSTRSHYPGAGRDPPNMRPWALNSLAVGLPAPRDEIERIQEVTKPYVRVNVHFRNHEMHHLEDERAANQRRKFLHPLDQIFPPLADNVV